MEVTRRTYISCLHSTLGTNLTHFQQQLCCVPMTTKDKIPTAPNDVDQLLDKLIKFSIKNPVIKFISALMSIRPKSNYLFFIDCNAKVN